MPDTSIDIIDLLHDIDPDRVTYIVQSDRKRYHAAITALVKERDGLRESVAELEAARNAWQLQAQLHEKLVAAPHAANAKSLWRERDERDALVAERDRLRIEAAHLSSTCRRERAERRDAEQQTAADRDLRERLVCAALTGLCAKGMHNTHTSDALSATAIVIADSTLAAMRKGEADGK